MALRRIKIEDGQSGKLMLDDVLAGHLATNPPDGVTAKTTVSAASGEVGPDTEDGLIVLKIRWTVEEPPDMSLPLEILNLRLGEFFPRATFVGGRDYDLSGDEPFRGRKLGFPYNTYYKFHIGSRHGYDAAMFSKMPIACWQERGRAFAIVFPKELKHSSGPLPVFIKASGAGAGVRFSAALLGEFEVERKSFGWFGLGSERETRELKLEAGDSFEAEFLLAVADDWSECVRLCEKWLYENVSPPAPMSGEALVEKLGAATRFYDRVWDSKNRTHSHLPVKDEPRFESVEFKHSHVTDDLTKLVLYRRLIGLGFSGLAARESALLGKLASEDYCYRRGKALLWHTTTRLSGRGLTAFTHHGVGLVGFPGGMATVTRRLFEYCSLEPDDNLAEMAISAADWLVEIQGEHGAWPAVVGSGPDVRDRNGPDCVAATAEAIRALIAAWSQTGKMEYRKAADAGLSYIGRDKSFFECRNYLRDVDSDNFDGMTAETCIHAFLDMAALGTDAHSLGLARRWGLYALQWIRPHCEARHAGPSFDGLSRSISPRIDVWGGLLIARAFLRLSRATGESSWGNHAWRLFENIAALQERDGGLSETWFLDYPSGIESIHIEPTFVADAFIEFILDALAEIPEAVPGVSGREYEPLVPQEESLRLATISADNAKIIIDGRLRIGFGFDGAYDGWSRTRQAAYGLLRGIAPGRALLKLVPATKILLNMHNLASPYRAIGESLPVNVLKATVVDEPDGLEARRFRTPLHEIVLSVEAEGADCEDRAAVDVGLAVETLAADVRLRQVRVDLGGRYEVISVYGKSGALVRCGGEEYMIVVLEGAVDEIIRRGDRLAFDISMRSNWNYYGEYRLRLRVTRRPQMRGTSET
jgi:hypothetical protein